MNKSCFKLYLGSTYKNLIQLDPNSIYERLLLWLEIIHLKAFFAKHIEIINESVEAVTSL